MDAEEIQLPYLETFSKAAELNSFTGAARALRLTQAAVSQRIAALEQALKKPLFLRQGGRVVLSDAGLRLYEYAQKILQLHREARRDVAGLETTLGGELVLAASSIPGEHLLPGLLAVFHQQHPDVQIRVSIGDSRSVMEQVDKGDVTLGFVGRKSDNPNLVFQPFARDRMLLLVPPNHPLSKRKTTTLKQLAEYPLLLRESGSGTRHCLEQALQRAGRALGDFKIALELGSNEAIKEAILKGMGVAVLSAQAVAKEVGAGRLCALELSDLNCEREMFIVHDHRRVLPLPARALLSFLEAHPL
ncbi:MAG: LysR family transcriptional regulator [Planctomycetes bacterium]|nr:LysR family transcriptional regulator [Planctomycetota bacterium]